MDDSTPFDFRSFHASHRIGMIVACSDNGVIGSEGDLPWRMPTDLKHFMRSTKGCSVIMGRKTFESLDQALPNRLNIVVSRTMDTDRSDGVLVARTIEQAVSLARDSGMESPIWIAGGGHIYSQSMDMVDLIVRTQVHADVEGDTVFPTIDEHRWALAHVESHEADDRHLYAMTIEWWILCE